MTKRMTLYSIAVYFMSAILLDASYQLHLTLGGDRFRPIEIVSTFVFFTVWLPLMPFVVRLAQRFAPVRGRRLRNFEIHFFAALAMSFLTLFAHKLVFCPWGSCYFGCLTYYSFEAWLVRWFTLDFFIYGGVVAAIWLSAAIERMRERELRATAIERELASAELRVMSAHVNPDALIEMFRSIAQRVTTQPAHAERMLMLVADFLRLNLRALGASDLTVADDLELLRGWIAMERERTGADLRLDVDLGSDPCSAPIANPRLQPLAAAAIREGATSITVRSIGQSVVRLFADGIEIGATA